MTSLLLTPSQKGVHGCGRPRALKGCSETRHPFAANQSSTHKESSVRYQEHLLPIFMMEGVHTVDTPEPAMRRVEGLLRPLVTWGKSPHQAIRGTRLMRTLRVTVKGCAIFAPPDDCKKGMQTMHTLVETRRGCTGLLGTRRYQLCGSSWRVEQVVRDAFRVAVG